jgi:site-specific DNA-methyltransferase (adenine-specific)
MEIHPAAALLPRMTDEEYRDLVADMRAHGQRVPIVVHDGAILDGRNRWQACRDIGIQPATEQWQSNGQSPVIWVLSMNVKRRHLTPSQKALIAADADALITELTAAARERQRQAAERTNATRRGEETLPAVRPEASTRGDTRDQAAQLTGASGRMVTRAEVVKAADPALAERVRQGEVTLTAAEHEVRQRKKQEEQKRRIAEAPRVQVADVRMEVADATDMPLDSDSVDLIWTSPPYGLEKPYHGQRDLAQAWLDLMNDFAHESFRVANDTGRLALNVPLDTSNGGYRPTWPQACMLMVGAGWTFRTTILWEKGNSTKGNRGLGSQDSADAPHPVAEFEVIGLFSKGEWKKRDGRPSDIASQEWQEWGNGHWKLTGETRAWEGHPAPFTEELTLRVLRYLSRVGDVVLDPFCGSGTTPLVAWRTKRVPIGFDLSETYIDSAKRRIAREQAQ